MRNRWVQMKAVPFISIIRTHNTKERQNKHWARWAAKVEDAICVSPLCNQRSLNVEEPSSRILLKYRKLQFSGDDCNHGNLTPLRSPISSTCCWQLVCSAVIPARGLTSTFGLLTVDFACRSLHTEMQSSLEKHEQEKRSFPLLQQEKLA